MDCKVLLLLALATLSGASELACPKGCECKSNRPNNVHAICSHLDLDKQSFSPSVTHLKVEYHPPGHGGVVLTDRAFHKANLVNLETIRIVGCGVKEIQKDAFYGLNKLKHVILSNNRIKHLDQDILSSNKNIQYLDLSGNPIELAPLGKENAGFLVSDDLRELNLSKCNITALPPKIFTSLPSLEYINLNDNDLTEISPDTFYNMINLESIDLSHNSISKIDKNVFADMDELSILSLKGNPLRNIDGLEAEKLQQLDISECNFEALTSNTFEGLSDIYSLNVSDNAIKSISKDAFTSLLLLRYLDFSSNNLQGPLDAFMFENNNHLEVISFAKNRELTSFPGFNKPIPNLYRLDLSNCGLMNLTNKSFIGMGYLDSLNLSGNALHHLPAKVFSSLSHLSVLDLSRNRISWLNSKIFLNNLHLHKLFLSHNSLSTLPAIIFSRTTTLTWLDMSHNHIIRLWNITESFVMKNRKILGKLTYLNVSGNKVKNLHMHSFVSMEHLEILDITNNPILCTQDFGHIIQWIISRKVGPSLNSGRELDDIKNNIQWEPILNSICPIDFTPKKSHQVDHELNKIKTVADKYRNDLLLAVTHKPVEDDPTDELPILESNFALPVVIVWVSVLLLLLALVNMVFVFIYKTGRQYRLAPYNPPPTLNGHFLVRKGGKSMYKKLYAECSEPAAVHHGHSSRFISILGFPQNRSNSNV